MYIVFFLFWTNKFLILVSVNSFWINMIENHKSEILLCEPCSNWKSIIDLINRQGKKTEMTATMTGKTIHTYYAPPLAFLIFTGLFWCGRLWYWTILRWEILLLDFFAVGDFVRQFCYSMLFEDLKKNDLLPGRPVTY